MKHINTMHDHSKSAAPVGAKQLKSVGRVLSLVLSLALGLVLVWGVTPPGLALAHETAPASEASSAPKPPMETKATLTIGVLGFRDKAITQARWQPLIAYLQREIPEYRFALSVLFLEEMEAAVAAHKVDFVLTNPAHYVLMAYEYGLSAPFASMVNAEGAFPTDQFGGVIFTRQDRDQIATLADVVGKKVVTVSTRSLGAFQMQAYTFLQKGIDLSNSVSILETGQPQYQAIEAVIEGRADVGFVRTGVLESMAQQGTLDVSQIKLLHSQRHPQFPFVTSTALYPEWPFSAHQATPKNLMRRVASAVLALPRDTQLTQSMNIAGFTLSGDYRAIDELMRQLEVAPFEDVAVHWSDLLQAWWLELLLALAGVVLGFLGLVAKLTLRQRQLEQEKGRMQAALEDLRLFDQVLEQSPQSIVLTNDLAQITYMNPAFEAITGYAQSEILGKNPRVLQSGQTPKAVYEAMWHQLAHGQAWRGELLNQRKNGDVFVSQSVITPVRDSRGKITHYLAIQQDVSEEKKKQARYEHLLYRDDLTGLSNQNHLLMRMDEALHHGQSAALKGCLVLINIDRFQRLNEQLGVDGGDAVLVALAQRLQQGLGAEIDQARLKDDEFAVFFQNRVDFDQDDDWLTVMGQRVYTLLEAPFMVKGQSISVSVTVGVASLMDTPGQPSKHSIHRTLNQAGVALKTARQPPQKTLCVFDHTHMDTATGGVDQGGAQTPVTDKTRPH